MNPMDPGFGKRPDGTPDYRAIARQQLLDEDRAAFEKRVSERERRLREAGRQLIATDFPTDPAELRQRCQECRAEHVELSKKFPLARSAADDERLRLLNQRIYEMEKRIRQLDRAAA